MFIPVPNFLERRHSNLILKTHSPAIGVRVPTRMVSSTQNISHVSGSPNPDIRVNIAQGLGSGNKLNSRAGEALRTPLRCSPSLTMQRENHGGLTRQQAIQQAIPTPQLEPLKTTANLQQIVGPPVVAPGGGGAFSSDVTGPRDSTDYTAWRRHSCSSARPQTTPGGAFRFTQVGGGVGGGGGGGAPSNNPQNNPPVATFCFRRPATTGNTPLHTNRNTEITWGASPSMKKTFVNPPPSMTPGNPIDLPMGAAAPPPPAFGLRLPIQVNNNRANQPQQQLHSTQTLQQLPATTTALNINQGIRPALATQPNLPLPIPIRNGRMAFRDGSRTLFHGSSEQEPINAGAPATLTLVPRTTAAGTKSTSPSRPPSPFSSTGLSAFSHNMRSPSKQTSSATSATPTPGPPAYLTNTFVTRVKNDELAPCDRITIAGHALEVKEVIGKGSFGSVWSAFDDNGLWVAIKEIQGESEASLGKATKEMNFMNRLHEHISEENRHRIPQCLYWDTQRKTACQHGGMDRSEWRIRMVMNQIDGAGLSQWLIKNCTGDKELAFHKASLMATRLLKQFAPVMRDMEHLLYHRDINSHNILIKETEDSCEFYLIDFGLAVDAALWRGPDSRRLCRPGAFGAFFAANTQTIGEELDGRFVGRPGSLEHGIQSWKTLDIAGDCKYWPTSAWKQFLTGWKSLSEDDAQHYRHRLDFHSLGITLYELMFFKGIVGFEEGMSAELRIAVNEVRLIWEQYWEQSTHYWSQLMGTFSSSKKKDANDTKDWNALRDLMRQSVTTVFQTNLAKLRQRTNNLLKLAFPPQWAHLRAPLTIMSDLIDVRGSFTWMQIEQIMSEGPDYEGLGSRPSQVFHTRARSIDTDVTSNTRLSTEVTEFPSSCVTPQASPRTHIRAKSDPEPELPLQKT